MKYVGRHRDDWLEAMRSVYRIAIVATVGFAAADTWMWFSPVVDWSDALNFAWSVPIMAFNVWLLRHTLRRYPEPVDLAEIIIARARRKAASR